MTWRTYLHLEAEATAWQGSARATIAAVSPGRTPVLHRRTPRTTQHPGDDDTGDATASSTPGQSLALDSVNNIDRSSPETLNRRRRFVFRSGMVAIWRRRKKSTNPRGPNDRSSRGGSNATGGVAGGGRSEPERGGDGGGGVIATESPER
jgi:hypothetical protein